jgi:hypothetical protein
MDGVEMELLNALESGVDRNRRYVRVPTRTATDTGVIGGDERFPGRIGSGIGNRSCDIDARQAVIDGPGDRMSG